MKRFYFKDELEKVNKTYGGQKRNITIYQLKNNDIIKLGGVYYYTVSTVGAISEVNQWLYQNKYITKRDIEKQTGDKVNKYNQYYFPKWNVKDNQYLIKEL